MLINTQKICNNSFDRRKGIILAGGHGTRLYPITRGTCKQLLPVYDKPMIYYPLATLMLAGIKDVLVISKKEDVERFKALLGNGDWLGINITYAVQDNPRGIAEAFVIGEKFIDGDSVCLILGDNIFFGHGLTDILNKAVRENKGATVFGYYVKEPKRYGVVEFDKKGNVVSIEEKPENPKSNYAVTGLYLYDNNVVDYVKKLKPSARGEMEITDLNNLYLKQDSLKIELLGRGFAWLDTGTYDSLLESGHFVKTIEERQALKIGCVEEIAYRMKYITSSELQELADSLKTEYGEYLQRIIKDEK